MKREYRTTWAKIFYYSNYASVVVESVEDPTPPEGSGWRLVGSCANATALFWTWERSVEDET